MRDARGVPGGLVPLTDHGSRITQLPSDGRTPHVGEGGMAGNHFTWSEEAKSTIDRLPERARAAVERRLGYLQQMPRMYAAARDGLFPGCRSFWVDPAYRVYYMVAAGGD